MNVARNRAGRRAGAELVLERQQRQPPRGRRLGLRGGRRARRSGDARRAGRNRRVAGRPRVPLRIDPMLEPIGFGFAASLGRYFDVRRRYPDAEMMMGIGNLTELTDADSAAINVLLLGFCQELAIHSVLTTAGDQLGPQLACANATWPGGSCIMPISTACCPSDWSRGWSCSATPKCRTYGDEALDHLAAKSRTTTTASLPKRARCTPSPPACTRATPIRSRCSTSSHRGRAADAAHAFYLGYEMAKAVTALTLGKDYRQDERARLGFLDPRRTIPPAGSRAEATASDASGTPPSAPKSLPLERADAAIRSNLRRGRRLPGRALRSATSTSKQAFVRLARRPHCVFLDSARRDPRWDATRFWPPTRSTISKFPPTAPTLWRSSQRARRPFARRRSRACRRFKAAPPDC